MAVVFIGDSYAAPGSTIPPALEEWLGVPVEPAGRVGWTARGWVAAGDARAAASPADGILVHLGPNAERPSADAVAELDAVWRQVTPRVAWLLPPRFEDGPIAGRWRTTLDALETAGVVIIGHGFIPGPDDTVDGVHLTRRGAVRYVDAVGPDVRRHVVWSRTPVWAGALGAAAIATATWGPRLATRVRR